MKKNQILNFIDWYKSEKEGNGSNYIANYFNDDVNTFVSAIIEYAVEFAITYGYNPFMVEKNGISVHINRIEKDLDVKGNTFSLFNLSKWNGFPNAILGKKNYLKYLKTIETKTELSTIEMDVVKVISSSINSKYTQEELFKNFTFRLITQDRFYKFLYFPISFYKKMFYYNNSKKFFDDLIKSQINNIIFHTENEKYLFSEIEILEITENDDVLIKTKKGQLHKLHTMIAGTNTKKVIKTNELRNIAIDHIIPFEKILLEIKNELPILSNIHKALIYKNNNNPIANRTELKNPSNLFFETVSLSEGNMKQLKKEFKLVFSKSKLQLMDKYENLAKKQF